MPLILGIILMGPLLLIANHMQASASNFTKSNTPSWVFFRCFKLHKMVPNRAKRLVLYQWIPSILLSVLSARSHKVLLSDYSLNLHS